MDLSQEDEGMLQDPSQQRRDLGGHLLEASSDLQRPHGFPRSLASREQPPASTWPDLSVTSHPGENRARNSDGELCYLQD